MRAPGARHQPVSCGRPAVCSLHAATHGVKSGYGFHSTCPCGDTPAENGPGRGRLSALMERVRPAADPRRRDLTGTPLFWLTIAVTLCAAVPFAMFRPTRAWVG